MTDCTCITEAFSWGPTEITCDSCMLTEFQEILARATEAASEAHRKVSLAAASVTR